jgi:hypothetical protein
VTNQANEAEQLLEYPRSEKNDNALRAWVKVCGLHQSGYFNMLQQNALRAVLLGSYFHVFACLNMLQRNAIRLRRLGNLLGCRDTEYISPSPTPSPPDAHVASSSNMYGHVEDEEVCIYFHYLCFILIIYQF